MFKYMVFVTSIFLLLAGACVADEMPAGLSESPFWGERTATFSYDPDIRIHVNVPSVENFNPEKPVALALYALPNGNTIEQTIGKKFRPGDDWHFDIQHIGAQTRFLREKNTGYNLVMVYLETAQKSWPAWKKQHANYAKIVRGLVDYLMACFQDYSPHVILTGHSGGGRFIFSCLDAFENIPDYVQRICFLDSNYGFEDVYGAKLSRWLKKSPENALCVLAYNDSVALYQGKTFVSPTGGTWYRSRMMQRYLAHHFSFETSEDTSFIRHQALDGRLQILLKKNPKREIYHTVQVECNGFIHSMVSGTALENEAYTYYGERAYANWIQPQEHVPDGMQIPLRHPEAKTGSEFMLAVQDLSFTEREEKIIQEIQSGNIPAFLRNLVPLTAEFTDAAGDTHQVRYQVMPDYLAIGSDSDFCRIPMGPRTAQRIADWFGAVLPTPQLVDDIYRQAQIKLEPVSYWPVGDANEKVAQFVRHNADIEEQRIAAAGKLGELTAGIKKDVVLSGKIADPKRPNHVVIYGWHRLDGNPIQPETNIHFDYYVDYSHGVRLLKDVIEIDGQPWQVTDVLRDSMLVRLLIDDAEPLDSLRYPVE